MGMLGEGAIAMWWDMDSAWRDEFEHWHTHEHFPERLGIPGFLRGSRWASADGGEGFFVMYELDRYETLSSPEYLARLNRPTPWSAKLMPQHRHMVRSQCRVLDTAGAGLSRHALTLRLSPAPGRDEELRGFLRQVAARFAAQPGATAAHLLRTENPALPVTTEQAIRGGRDASADWIFIANGYVQATLHALRRTDIADDVLVEHGALAAIRQGQYVLCCVATPADLRHS
jgi:hypothetical protein